MAWAAGAAAVSAASGKVFLTPEEALKLAFPAPATVRRETAFLTPQQQAEVARLSATGSSNAVVTYYVGERGGREVGTVYFDTHVIRTEKETILVEISPERRVVRVEILSFSEPQEYMPRPRWYEQFSGRALDDDLSVKRGIAPVTGATLTVRATVDAVRRVLAFDEVIRKAKQPQQKPAAEPKP
jgi:FMN-binding domain